MSGDIGEIMGHKIDMKKVNNRALRRVIRERAECNEFMFRYGDHDQYKEEHKEYGDHKEKYKEHVEHKEYADTCHTDKNSRHLDASAASTEGGYGCMHSDYSCHSDHSEKKK